MSQETNDTASLVTTFFDSKGRPVELYPDSPGSHFLGFMPPKTRFLLSRDLCHPRSLADDETAKVSLYLAAIHMAQSPTGRAALQAMERYDIRLGFDQTLPHGQTHTGSDEESYYIMLDPAARLEAQHLAIIYGVAQIEAIIRIVEGLDALPKQSIDGIMARAMRISGVIAMMNHGEECIAAKKEYERRFVPPKLAEVLHDMLSTPSLKGMDVPADRAERDRLRAHLVAAARTVLTPQAGLRGANFRNDEGQSGASPKL